MKKNFLLTLFFIFFSNFLYADDFDLQEKVDDLVNQSREGFGFAPNAKDLLVEALEIADQIKTPSVREYSFAVIINSLGPMGECSLIEENIKELDAQLSISKMWINMGCPNLLD